MVPPSVPREVRYETIRGKLEPIEHFKAEDIGIGQGGKRGYNNYHGWDEGASPRVPGRKNSAAETKTQSGNGGKAEKGSDKAPGKVSSASQNLERPKKSPAVQGLNAALVKEVKSSVAATVGSVQSGNRSRRKPIISRVAE